MHHLLGFLLEYLQKVVRGRHRLKARHRESLQLLEPARDSDEGLSL